MLGQFATEDRTTGLTAAICNAGHDGGHCLRVKVPPELVVEEKEWFGALTDEVVDAHRHEVYPDRPEPPSRDSDRKLGAYPVRGGHQDGLAVARRHRKEAPETADAAYYLRPDGALDGRPH